MEVKEEIQNALKSGNIIMGYRRSIKYIKMRKPKAVVMANNIPDSLKRDLVHNANLSGVAMETFSGSSIDLGVFCGKPFPIAVLTIK